MNGDKITFTPEIIKRSNILTTHFFNYFFRSEWVKYNYFHT